MRWNRIEKHSDGVAWRCSANEMNCYELRSKGVVVQSGEIEKT